ncbi:beta-hexosaminidase [Marinobacterium nitratireducens]|uniref:Beta-hexosaminidase n=1 Tax=Marinobacterium nitratireducens TaxID=518897 RepID=A0A917ZET3_9GAMM|nr:beta-N-acetylhexosaminidase [Marinobacterium nitratireducens]GGO80559.1 beta-hexosaminidase [Marinobacterium nitratireducens]
MTAPVLMLDLEGTRLSAMEAERLTRPGVGGVILFSRNYQNPEQLRQLVADVRAQAPDVLIAVDHEGGRVQRFRDGFTHLPAMGALASRHTADPAAARAEARELGWLMASELVSLDIDLSFAPVLDLDYGRSRVIGDRAFGAEAAAVTALAGAFVEGMREAGMAATGKHFPGHGWAEADSHLEIPVDERPYAAIEAADMQPFAALIRAGLDGIMPAHVIYSRIDDRPAGFSRHWLQQVLRGDLGFDGIIFSDDLSMEGAGFAGGYSARAASALEAGCDMLLVCNDPRGACEVLDWLDAHPVAAGRDARRLRHRAVAQPDPGRLERARALAARLREG